ncbi:hypothetical protein CHH28_13750 [Bacterioplanes sanyensis]|uniref:DUF6436 domain-containing protein n=1 Tax=Bacterioplanes sanyensis TaxID=1249553 RepID=A0A222FLL5_9GAMM|nr:DUF6436 domain-containing protein [Bacterioplanes sanyensis]ASP39670.1 hypothetical protein CHH28_13750 [Bacterioplanes sanyensis]
MKTQHWWMSIAVMVLFGATLVGLWWFQQQAVRPFITASDSADYWQAAQVEQRLQPLWQQLSDSQQPTLMHFWNPDCLCNQVSHRHYASLLEQFGIDDLRVVVVAPHTSSEQQRQQLLALNDGRIQVLTAPANLELPSSPSLALFHSEGQLAYFGAYGFGALCTVADDQLFPTLVERLQSGPYGPFMSVAGDGCFCAWPAADASD